MKEIGGGEGRGILLPKKEKLRFKIEWESCARKLWNVNNEIMKSGVAI